MTTDWTIELTRTCHACKGTGRFQRPPSIGPGQTTYSQGMDPVDCPTCSASGVERKAVTLEDLKAMLAL
jgi:hypothetical protein